MQRFQRSVGSRRSVRQESILRFAPTVGLPQMTQDADRPPIGPSGRPPEASGRPRRHPVGRVFDGLEVRVPSTATDTLRRSHDAPKVATSRQTAKSESDHPGHSGDAGARAGLHGWIWPPTRERRSGRAIWRHQPDGQSVVANENFPSAET